MLASKSEASAPAEVLRHQNRYFDVSYGEETLQRVLRALQNEGR
jgi:hypothetical protein